MEALDELFVYNSLEIYEVSLVEVPRQPAVPDATFVVVKSEEPEAEDDEILEEEEVSKAMDIGELLTKIIRRLKNALKEDSKEKIQKRIEKLLKDLQKIVEEGGEYGYPLPYDVSKMLDEEEEKVSEEAVEKSDGAVATDPHPNDEVLKRVESLEATIKDVIALQGNLIDIVSTLIQKKGGR